MKGALRCIMLIDDNVDDNFFHERAIKQAEVFDHIVSLNSAQAALAYLKDPQNPNYILPEVIFLDINMPGMDGWDFLDEFSKIDYIDISDIKIIMLSTSSRTEDIEKAKKNVFVDNYTIKPLNYDNLVDLIEEHFN